MGDGLVRGRGLRDQGGQAAGLGQLDVVLQSAQETFTQAAVLRHEVREVAALTQPAQVVGDLVVIAGAGAQHDAPDQAPPHHREGLPVQGAGEVHVTQQRGDLFGDDLRHRCGMAVDGARGFQDLFVERTA
ncbi:hypothetical protein ACFFX0_31360 [Citricoccus parietis]|uniref:Uncharacterized protein n=1 Tax=Citricoccus parietis TaxID=592307 RepID=A0ABV5G912_9MICC